MNRNNSFLNPRISMTFSDISTTPLPLSLSGRSIAPDSHSLSLKYSSSPSFPGNYCLSFQPEPQEIPSSSESSWLSQQALAMSPQVAYYTSPWLSSQLQSLIAFVAMFNVCLPPDCQPQAGSDGPSGLLLQERWVTTGPSSHAHLHPPWC